MTKAPLTAANQFSFTLSEAQNSARKNKIEEWINAFLMGEGDNIPLAEGLKLVKRYYTKPVKIELNQFERDCGPEPQMTYKVTEESFTANVKGIQERLNQGWDMPPLIFNYHNNKFTLSDGNHRYEALIRTGIKEYYAVFWASSEQDFEDLHSKLNALTEPNL